MIDTEVCIARLQAAADVLASEGADQFSLVIALIEVVVQTAYEDRPQAATHLEGASLLLKNALEGARLDKELDEIRAALKALRQPLGKK